MFISLNIELLHVSSINFLTWFSLDFLNWDWPNEPTQTDADELSELVVDLPLLLADDAWLALLSDFFMFIDENGCGK